MRQFYAAALAFACLIPSLWAGEISGNQYTGGRYGAFAIQVPAGEWLILDRESSGENSFGGPQVELKSTRAIGSVFPVVMISAYRRAAEDVTPDFLLRTSREAMQQKGAQPGPVLVRTVDGRKIRFFDTQVTQKGQAAVLYYVLLEGREALFAAQVVVPPQDIEAVRKVVDRLLDKARY